MGQNNPTNMQALWESAMLDAGSAAWVESLYESFLRNPNDVDVRWREFFSTLPRVNGATADVPHSEIRAYFRQLTERSGGLQTAPAVKAANTEAAMRSAPLSKPASGTGSIPQDRASWRNTGSLGVGAIMATPGRCRATRRAVWPE